MPLSSPRVLDEELPPGRLQQEFSEHPSSGSSGSPEREASSKGFGVFADMAKRNSISFPSGMKINSGALSGLGAKGAASVFKRRATVDLSEVGSAPNGTPGTSGNGMPGSLQIEVDGLREQLRTMREVYEDALQEQQQAAEAHRVELLRSCQRSWRTPAAEDLRRAVRQAEEEAGDPDKAGAHLVSDEFLQCVAGVALGIASGEFGPPSSIVDAGGKSSAESDSEDDDEEKFLLLKKISVQQQELERLREASEKQQAQIARLTMQVAEGGNDSGPKVSESKKVLEGKLRDTQRERDTFERQVKSLTERLEESEEASRQTYELRCNFQTIVEKLKQRDAVLDDAQAQCAVLRDRLRFSQEDLRCASERHERLRSQLVRSVASIAVGCPEEHSLDAHSRLAQPAAEGTDLRTTCAGAPAAANEATEEGLLESTSFCLSCASRSSEAEKLRADLEELQIAKALFEKRTAREMQELRSLVREQHRKDAKAADASSRAAGEETIGGSSSSSTSVSNQTPAATHQATSEEVPLTPRKAAVECFDMSVDDSPMDAASPPLLQSPEAHSNHREMVVPQSASVEGLLYVQKIAELERLNAGLAEDLVVARASEQCLQEDNKEKNTLINNMLKKVKPADVDGSVKPRWRGMLGGFPKIGAARHDEADWEELSHCAEEAMKDNLRLRNDLQLLAEELRKAMTENQNLRATGQP